MKFVPVLETLDSRLQPGSMLSSGTNLSLLGLAVGGLPLPDLASPDTPAHVAALPEPTGVAPAGIVPSEVAPAHGQAVLGDFDRPESMPANPDTQTAAADLQALTQGQSGELERGFHHQPRTLWYNGDWDGRNSLSSESNTIVSDARTYDDFTVTHPRGWDVTHVWGNFQMTTNVQGANFEIRSGVSSGQGGTIVASGSDLPVTLTPHPAGNLLDITVDVQLPEALHLDAGTYWLTVQPIGFGAGRAFVTTTSGVNSVGSPPGNNGNSFFDSRFFNFNFAPTNSSTILGSGTWDFSYGVGGFPTRRGL